MRQRGQRVLVLIAAVAVATASVVAGATAGASTGQRASTGGGGDGILRYGLEAETDGLNPTVNRFAIAAYSMGQAVFDPLFRVGNDGKFHPHLLESATPSSDYTYWDLKARENIEFHDGTPFNAEAMKANLDASLSDPLIGLAIRDFFPTDSDPFEVMDELTLRVHMDGPNPHLPQYLVAQIGYMASPTWMAAAKANPDLNQEPVGTGPFVFESRVQDSSTTFLRNDNYWRGKVKLEGIEFVIQTDPARRADQLLSGAIDVMHTSDPSTIKSLESEDVQQFSQDHGEEGFLMINSQEPPFDDIRAREALTLATPPKDYMKILGQGVVDQAETMFHPSLPFNNPKVKQKTDKPAAAKKLAKEYCAEFPDNCEGDKIKFTYKYTGPSEVLELTADVMIDGWKTAFAVEREQLLQDDYILGVATGNYQVVIWRQFGADDPDGDFTWLDCRHVGDKGALSITWTRWCDDEIQALGLEQRATDSKKEQARIWKKITALLNKDFVYIFLIHDEWLVAANNRVKNVVVAKQADGKGKTVLGNGTHSMWQMSMSG